MALKLAQALNESQGVLITDFTYSSTSGAWNNWHTVYRVSNQTHVTTALRYAVQACNNPYIGYSQSNRISFYNQAIAFNKNISAINVQCWCDCSSFVSGLFNLAGADIPYNLTTRNMDSYFRSIGTALSYTPNMQLRNGDVLLANGHTAMVYGSYDPTPTDDYFQDIEGFWHRRNGYLGNFSEYAKYNALLLASLLREQGWSNYGIAGVFSAITYESQFDSQLIEGMFTHPERTAEWLKQNPTASIGAGLLQWTNGYRQLISFCEGWNIDWKLNTSQVRKLELERTTPDSNVRQYFSTIETYRNIWNANFSKNPPATMTDYVKATTSQWSYREMATAWILFYTRPSSYADQSNWNRNAEAMEFWYNYIEENPEPVPPTPPIQERRKMPIWFYLKRRY